MRLAGRSVRKLLHTSSVTKQAGSMQDGMSFKKFWLILRVRSRGRSGRSGLSWVLQIMTEMPQLRSKISSNEGGKSSACKILQVRKVKNVHAQVQTA